MGNDFSGDLLCIADDVDKFDKNDNNYSIKPHRRGSLGVVSLCKHKARNEKIARKEYWVDEAHASGEKEDEERKRRSKYMEENAASVIKLRHPSIVSYLWAKKTQGTRHLHVYMEFCPGGSIDKLVADRKSKSSRLEEPVICRYVRNVAAGLEFLHGKMIIHRNLRPTNILLSEDLQEAKIADFGEGAILQDDSNLRRTTMGPPRYQAPEMSASLPYSFEVDVWALGLIIHEMGTLEVPTPKSAMPKIDDKFMALNENYSEKLRELVIKMLTTRVNERIKVEEINKHPAIANNSL